MTKLSTRIARTVIHTFTGSRKFYYRNVRAFASTQHDKTILELGSGKAVNGQYSYSTAHLFPEDNEFVMSDLNKDFGHQVIDVTTMRFRSKFDAVLCLNVLEHVYDYSKALANLHKALKRRGTLIIAVPFGFPLHDEPSDYWRFTEHALRRLLSEHGFRITKFKHNGKRQAPFGYYLEAVKK